MQALVKTFLRFNWSQKTTSVYNVDGGGFIAAYVSRVYNSVFK